jgi:RecA-family ATPase
MTPDPSPNILPGILDLAAAAAVDLPSTGGIFNSRPLTELFDRLPKNWLVQDWFGPGDLVMIFGDSGTGKTFLTIDMIVCGAMGKPIAGKFNVTRRYRTLYCTEEGIAGLRNRFMAAVNSYGLTNPDEWIRWMDVIPGFNATDEKSVDAFIAQVKESGFDPEVIVFDTWSDFLAGARDNDNSDALIGCRGAQRIARELNCTVVVIHHASKASGGTEYRGPTTYKAKMDLMVLVEGGITNPKKVSCQKLKDGKQWFPIFAELIEYEDSVTVRWLGDQTPLPTNRDAKTLEWQTDLIEAMEKHAASEEQAKTVRELKETMMRGETERTVRDYLASESKRPGSRIKSVEKQLIGKDKKPNKTAWHFWIKPAI